MNRTRLMSALSIGLGAALVTGCSSGAVSKASSGSAGQGPATASPSAVVGSPAATTTSFEGTWQAGPTPVESVLDHLAKVRLGRFTPDFLQGHAPTEQISYGLKLQGGVVLVTSTIDGQAQGVMDREQYRAAGHTLSLEPFGSDCSSAFRWRVAGGRLTLRPTSDSCPDYKGAPDLVYMHSLYGSAPYVRAL
jgi:hypothetical protein